MILTDDELALANGTKPVIVSVSMPPETRSRLKTTATLKGWGVSKLVRTLIDRYMKYLDAEGATPVVLLVPHELRSDEAAMRAWLNKRMNAIASQLVSRSTT